jgi:hypothetical protein
MLVLATERTEMLEYIAMGAKIHTIRPRLYDLEVLKLMQRLLRPSLGVFKKNIHVNPCHILPICRKQVPNRQIDHRLFDPNVLAVPDREIARNKSVELVLPISIRSFNQMKDNIRSTKHLGNPKSRESKP